MEEGSLKRRGSQVNNEEFPMTVGALAIIDLQLAIDLSVNFVSQLVALRPPLSRVRGCRRSLTPRPLAGCTDTERCLT